MRLHLLVVVALFVARSASADGFAIHVLDTQYRTDLSTRMTFPDVLESSDARTGATPLLATLATTPVIFASASADLFFVQTSTSAVAVGAFADALAESVLTFAPDDDGIATIGLTFQGTPRSTFSFASVSLRDLVTDSVLWAYGWDRLGMLESTIPFTCCYSAAVNVSHGLVASHQYALTMRVGTDANADHQALQITATGLEATVPEPGTLWLSVIAGLALVGSRRSRRDAPGRQTLAGPAATAP